jgi:hypothetical protein
MSDYGDLFTSFYTQFILRDLLSIILPGFIVIITLLTFWGRLFLLGSIFSNEISFLLIFLILGLSYFIGILFIFLSDVTGFCKTYYTETGNLMRERTKKFHETIVNEPKGEKIPHERFANIRERYIIFAQTCGNMAWASLTIIFYGFVLAFGYNKIAFLLPFYWVLLVFSVLGHCHYQINLENWDDIIIDC